METRLQVAPAPSVLNTTAKSPDPSLAHSSKDFAAALANASVPDSDSNAEPRQLAGQEGNKETKEKTDSSKPSSQQDSAASKDGELTPSDKGEQAETSPSSDKDDTTGAKEVESAQQMEPAVVAVPKMDTEVVAGAVLETKGDQVEGVELSASRRQESASGNGPLSLGSDEVEWGQLSRGAKPMNETAKPSSDKGAPVGGIQPVPQPLAMAGKPDILPPSSGEGDLELEVVSTTEAKSVPTPEVLSIAVEEGASKQGTAPNHELLTQLQGSRQVQEKLQSSVPPSTGESGRTIDTVATHSAVKPQEMVVLGEGGQAEEVASVKEGSFAKELSPSKGRERLDPELAKELGLVQTKSATPEPGLRSSKATSELMLQTQSVAQAEGALPEAVKAASSLEADGLSHTHSSRGVESRAMAQADAQAALRQPVAAERMAPELRERMMMMINSRTNQAEVRLDPPELGALQVKIQVKGDQAQVQLHAQQLQTRELVEQALPRLREMFAQQGITLADTQISHGGQGDSGAQDRGTTADNSGLAGDGLVEASDEALMTVQQMTGRNADGGIDYYA